MRLIFASLALLLWGLPLAANEKVDRLADAMQLEQFMQILVEEGEIQRRELDKSMLENRGGAFFEAQVEDIFNPVWMKSQLTEAMQDTMSDEELDQAIVFFESDLGQMIISLENSARRAFSDDAIEDMAMDAYKDTPPTSMHYELIEEYIQVNNLIEQNVQGAISADFHFYRGLAFGRTSDDGEILADLLSQKDRMIADTTDWVFSFLLLAYRPLNESQLRQNIAFSRTDTGRALNEALFVGFDGMFDTISFHLGEAVAQALRASEL